MMNKYYYCILTFWVSCFFSLASLAQEAPKDTSYWKKASKFGLNLSQGTFNDGWQGGGLNNIALGVYLNSKGEYTRDRNNWVNDFQFQLGAIKNKGDAFRKSVDRLFFDSKYGRKLGEVSKWYFFTNLNFLTQIANGRDFGNERMPFISAFFTPAYLTEAIGIEWKPNKFFSMQFSPGAVRQTILGNKNLYKAIDLLAPEYKFSNYGVERGKSVRNEVAIMQLVMNFDKDIVKDVNFKWRYQAFAGAKDLRAIDNRLDAQLTAKFAKYFNVNLGLIAIYDQDQVAQMQLAQSINFGFLYSW
ncbi:DUF3078 domain-containing protein [Runella salmonicolor]|uniref:DUF3078 domain-containing protein n=1 Tax=Runella salmonicolor TaxID=2950278 RepID=A0ABT1FWA4_9BACT|nr:DUF3078 domain-containing protein [Runella salmonicolor]MCP1386046.1 DUF3078 domain-containing protein [Runella salmonicolor]